jgi:hypothetical protein
LTTTTKTTRPAAAQTPCELSTTARVAAQVAHADAIEAIETARRHDASLRDRLTSGDASVSGADLAAAAGDIDRMRLLALAAGAAVTAAQAVEAPLVAARWAKEVGMIVDPATQVAATAKAVAAIGAALTELAAVCETQVETISRATADAKAAGVANFRDPIHRVGMGTTYVGYSSRPTDVLTFDGEPIFPADVAALALAAIVDGASVAGFIADGEYGRVRVRTLASAAR